MWHIIICAYSCKPISYNSIAKIYAFCLIFTLLLFALAPINAQSEVQGTSTVIFNNEKLSAILINLSETRNLNFTYDANDPVYDEVISYSSEGNNTEKMLQEILSNTGLKYKQIGNQIVLYQSEEKPAENNKTETFEGEQPNNSEEKIISGLIGSGTILEYKLDTIYLMDTIFRVDTIRLTDTVFIEKTKPENPASAKIKKIPVDFFQPGMVRDQGWAMDVFAAPLLSDFSLVDGQKSFSLRSFSLGFDAIKLLNRWNIAAGLRLTHFNQRFTQQYTQEEGGFYATDTIDAYYTVIDMDTAWYYVTDSSWVPLQTQQYIYEQKNLIGYLELNASASFDIYQSPKTRVYLKAGGQVSFLIYNNGIAIPDKNQGEGVDFDQLQFNTINYSILLGAGFKYRLSDKTDFYSELYYSGYLNSLVPDFPVNTKFNAIGLKFGLVFYF